MERIVVSQMRSFLDVAGLLDKDQHGFSSGRSTETQLLRTVNDGCRNRSTPCCEWMDF